MFGTSLNADHHRSTLNSRVSLKDSSIPTSYTLPQKRWSGKVDRKWTYRSEKKQYRSSHHREFSKLMTHIFSMVPKTTKPPLFTIHCHILQCLQPNGWRVFWSPTMETRDTSYVVHFHIPRCHVIRKGCFKRVSKDHFHKMLTHRSSRFVSWEEQETP